MMLLAVSLAGFVAAATAHGASLHEPLQPSLISAPVGAAPLTPCMPASGVHPAREPCRAVPGRRAVPQMIERMPLQQPSPRVHGVPPFPAAPSGLVPSVPSAPRPLTGCVPGACRDAAGGLYNGGVGNATLDPNGRLCNRDGAWLQCF